MYTTRVYIYISSSRFRKRTFTCQVSLALSLSLSSSLNRAPVHCPRRNALAHTRLVAYHVAFHDKDHGKSSLHAANVAGKLKVTFLSRDANSLGERSSGGLVDPVKSFLEIDQLED